MAELPRGVSPLGARRGGPGTFAGIDYQLTVMTYWALTLIDDAQRHPTHAVTLRVEPRQLVSEGQVGDDLAWSGSRQHGTRRVEIKANPTLQDIKEFIEGLAALDAEPESAFLVAGSETSAFRDLELLVNLAFEANDEAEFAERVARHDSIRSTLADLIAHAGERPREVLRRSLPPDCATERSTDRQVTQVAQILAVPGRAQELLGLLHSRLTVAARRRESFDVAVLIDELRGKGLLQPVTTIDYTDESDTVIAALALLDGLPTALPVAVVASVLGISNRELNEQLADQLTDGHVTSIDGNLACILSGVTHPRVQDLRAQALSELTTMSVTNAAAVSEQAPNILHLAARVISHRPHLVADVFVAFEKGAKLFGDLWLTYRLARLSYQACEAAAEGADASALRRLQDNKVRSIICGEAWTLQRVGELQRADGWLSVARELNEGTADLVNDAFLDKCAGRLKRLLAEAQSVGSADREQYLRDSETLLVAAHDKFRAVVANGETRCLDDVGECQSLLARTYWESDQPAKARAAADLARTYLREFAQSKAAADLAVLEIEMELSQYLDHVLDGAAPDSAGLSVGVAKLDQIITVYSGESHAGQREPSEIIARCLLLRARLSESLGDIAQSANDLAAVARLYDRMNYRLASADAEVRRIVLTGALPQGLLAELDRRNATAGTRLHALRHRLVQEAIAASDTAPAAASADNGRALNPSGGAGDETADLVGENGPKASAPTMDPLMWESVVTEAEHRDAVTSPRWGLSLPLGA